MEELKEAALYYLETASDEYKQQARRALKNGESLEDLYVRETKKCIVYCHVCTKLLFGFYFCCTKCEWYKECIYNLCVKCFYGGTFHQEHGSFADNHSLLMMHREGRFEPSCVIEEKPKGKGRQQPPVKVQQTKELVDKGKGKHDLPIVARQIYTRSQTETKISASNSNPSHLSVKRMEIDEASMKMLARIAKVHYDAAPQNIRDSADMFWRSMVKEQSEKNRVSFEAFKEWMNKNGYTEYGFDKFFEAIVEDRNVGMNICESRTLYYILVSGRPFCSNCHNFIPDIQFYCSKRPARKYALCIDCYESKAYRDHGRT